MGGGVAGQWSKPVLKASAVITLECARQHKRQRQLVTDSGEHSYGYPARGALVPPGSSIELNAGGVVFHIYTFHTGLGLGS